MEISKHTRRNNIYFDVEYSSKFISRHDKELSDISIYFFFKVHGNESCDLIGSLPGLYFPISAHGQR